MGKIRFESWMLSFVGIVVVRIFLEQFSSFLPSRYVLIDAPTIIHYATFYLAVMAGVMAIFMVATKKSLQEISILCLFGLVLLWLPPIIDLVFAGEGGFIMTYLFVSGRELLVRFFSFFGNHIAHGITLGIQVEIALFLIGSFVYVYLVTKKIFRAICATLGIYIFIFLLVAMPSIISLFLNGTEIFGSSFPGTSIYDSIAASRMVSNNISPGFSASTDRLLDLGFNKSLLGINLLVAVAGGLVVFFHGARRKFIALMKNSRPERIIHFFLLFLFGAALANVPFFKNWLDIQSYLLGFIAFACAWMVCVCQNDIYDEAIDAVSNATRPLIVKEVSREDLETASKIFLLVALLAAYAASHYVLFFTILFFSVYYLYSNPPFRLKRFVGLNSGLVSIACMAIILAGFFLTSPDKHITAIPFGMVLAIFIFFATVSNIRDIKDVEGDRAQGIRTLPVLIGTRRAKALIAGMICFFFLALPWYLHLPQLLIPSFVATILSWYFITAKQYVEWKGFVVYMGYLVLVIMALIIQR